MLLAFGFRNANQKLRFAATVSTAACAADAISMGDGGDYQSIEEHKGCGNDQ
jgi:hypothetical protein